MAEDRGLSDVAPHRGVLILTLGILSLIVCQPLGFAAWLMGSNDLKEMRAGRMDRQGESLTQAGQIIGIIGSVLTILGLVIGCLWMGLVLTAVGAGVAAGPH
ncbi:MAG TPA: hypothetical protein VFG20_08510 [Planctomycetaceae bacterium]|nr:hypothetical protein [Planctomycetaceae bacterium]